MSESAKLEELLQRIATALERQAPAAGPKNDIDAVLNQATNTVAAIKENKRQATIEKLYALNTVKTL